MAFTARPAVDCSTFTGRHHHGPSPAYAGYTDTNLSESVDQMLRYAVAADPEHLMSDRRIWLAEADACLTELAERKLWPPRIAALDDAAEAALERDR